MKNQLIKLIEEIEDNKHDSDYLTGYLDTVIDYLKREQRDILDMDSQLDRSREHRDSYPRLVRAGDPHSNIDFEKDATYRYLKADVEIQRLDIENRIKEWREVLELSEIVTCKRDFVKSQENKGLYNKIANFLNSLVT